MKNKKLLFASLVFAGVGAVSITGGIMASTYNLFNRKLSAKIKNANLDKLEDVPYDYSWLKKYKTEDLYITSFDNLKLYGLRINSNPKSHNWVIMVHGYKSLGMMMIDRAYEFVKEGYNVLLIDQRCCGKSEGEYMTFGWLEHYDVLDWINTLVNYDNEAKIVLYGFSMGGTTVMNVSGEYLVENVKCIIEDSGFTSMKDQLAFDLKKKYKPNKRHTIIGLDYLLKKKCGFGINDANTLKQLQQSVTPILFIHGEEDKVVPYEMVFDNYYACNSEKELFTVHGANHLETVENKHYYDRVFRFIERFI